MSNVCISWLFSFDFCSSCFICGLVVMVTAVVAALQGSFSGELGVAEQGLWAIRNLAMSEDNMRLLVAAGACEGE